MKVCNDGGYLVGPDHWIPEEPSDHFGVAYGIRSIGCNHLVCGTCGAVVRHTVEGTARRYRCTCTTHDELGATRLDTSLERDPDPVPSWSCAGHPGFTPPGVFAGVTFGPAVDWAAVVREHLVQTSHLHRSVDVIPGFVLSRIYQGLERDEDRNALAIAVTNHADDPDLRARQAVVLFHALNDGALGIERVLEAWRSEPARYDGHPAGFGPHALLVDALIETACVWIIRGGPEAEAARAMLRWAALRGTGLGASLHYLTVLDWAWAEEHVEAMLALAPADWFRIIRAIHVAFPMRFVPGLSRAIREGHATADEVATALRGRYPANAESVMAAVLAWPGDN